MSRRQGLAPRIGEEVIKLILEINKGGTAILWVVEENPSGVLKHCPRVYLIESGQIRRTDSGQNLLNDPKFAELFLGCILNGGTPCYARSQSIT